MTHEEYRTKIREIAQRDTSADPEGWTAENPLWGHCAVVSLLAQEMFGGALVRGSLKDHPSYSYLRSHFWNKLPDDTAIDFTSEQYPDLSFKELRGKTRTRGEVLAYPDTVRRYNLLKERFEK